MLSKSSAQKIPGLMTYTYWRYENLTVKLFRKNLTMLFWVQLKFKNCQIRPEKIFFYKFVPKVTVVANWFPRSIFGRCRALCMYLRMIFAALYLCFFSSNRNLVDVVFVDQVSHCVPILKIFSNFKVLFYCHYPDQLLSKKGVVKKSG